MTFLTPWSALIAAGLALPALLLLYFLRLRRQRLRVPSTLLWEKSFEDLQANTLFQRLRWSLILLLQLLLLLALLLALAQPVASGEAVLASRSVLLVDRSASMNAAIGDQRTRLDAAKEIGRQLIEALGRGDRTRQMMIIAFGATPEVVSVYESNRAALLDALNSIAPTDEQADLPSALELAGAYAGGAGETPDQQPPQVVLISDNPSADPSASANDVPALSLRAGSFRFIQVTPDQLRNSVDNIGIAAFSVRRDANDPASVLTFVRVLNAGRQPIEAVFTFWIDDRAGPAVRRTIPAASDNAPGEDSFTVRVEVTGAAVVSVRHNRPDQLPADDAAFVVLPAPARPRIALVHPNDSSPDPFLEDLIAAIEPEQISALTADAWAGRMSAGMLQDSFDLAVFDRVVATPLPPLPSLTFGAVPAPLGAIDALELGAGQAITSWDRQHPLMRDVALDTIVFTGAGGIEAMGAVQTLAYGQLGSIIVETRSRGHRHVVVGFEFRKSNWPLHVSSAVFMQNVVDYLTLARLGTTGLSFRAGEAVPVRAATDATAIQIQGPLTRSVAVEPGGIVTLPVLRRAGLYRVSGATSPHEQIAVNVASDRESDIRPAREIVVNAESSVAARDGTSVARPLWPWLLSAALALLALEWVIYCRRAAG